MAISGVVIEFVGQRDPYKMLIDMDATSQAAKELASKMLALSALYLAAWDLTMDWTITRSEVDDGEYAWWVNGQDNLTHIMFSYPER